MLTREEVAATKRARRPRRTNQCFYVFHPPPPRRLIDENSVHIYIGIRISFNKFYSPVSRARSVKYTKNREPNKTDNLFFFFTGSAVYTRSNHIHCPRFII